MGGRGTRAGGMGGGMGGGIGGAFNVTPSAGGGVTITPNQNANTKGR